MSEYYLEKSIEHINNCEHDCSFANHESKYHKYLVDRYKLSLRTKPIESITLIYYYLCNYLGDSESAKEKLFKKKNNMILIGRYDRFSKYTAKNIARYMNEKNSICVIPYCTLFFEACNESKVADFFLRLKNIDDSDRNAVFLREVNNASEVIDYKLKELKATL